MRKFAMWIPVPLLNWFVKFAKRHDMKVSEALRQALREFKDREDRRK